MTKQRKIYHPITVRMDIDIYDRLDAYCEQTGLSKTGAVEQAVKFFLDARDAEKDQDKLQTKQ